MELKMDYMSAVSAAQKWGIGIRQVQRLLADGRIPNAQKLGNSWVIPVSAEKPLTRALIKSGTAESHIAVPLPVSLQERLAAMCKAVYINNSRDNPYGVIDSIKDEKLRSFHIANLFYMKGDFKQAKRYCKTTEGDEAAKLLISGIAIAVAISSGDYAFYDEYETFLKAVIKSKRGAEVTSYAELMLALGYMGAGLPEMAAEWIKKADFTNVYPVVKYTAICLRIEYFRWQKKYESMLSAAEAILSLSSDDLHREFNSIEIQLMTRCAIACHYLDRMDEAKRWLMSAMDIAFPHGFTVLFTSIITDLSGLLERCTKQAYPEYYDKIIAQSRQIVNNWVAFHIRCRKNDNAPFLLSIQEQKIANLAARRVPYAEISRRLDLSLGTIKNTVQVIYSKMNVNNRDELYEALW
ncbi:MAG: helix-turn-helix transcriptional regulator [Treponema sp.]|nr:helix-turn-helix transcriptional regulator [Treponema sp.]